MIMNVQGYRGKLGMFGWDGLGYDTGGDEPFLDDSLIPPASSPDTVMPPWKYASDAFNTIATAFHVAVGQAAGTADPDALNRLNSQAGALYWTYQQAATGDLGMAGNMFNTVAAAVGRGGNMPVYGPSTPSGAVAAPVATATPGAASPVLAASTKSSNLPKILLAAGVLWYLAKHAKKTPRRRYAHARRRRRR